MSLNPAIKFIFENITNSICFTLSLDTTNIENVRHNFKGEYEHDEPRHVLTQFDAKHCWCY